MCHGVMRQQEDTGKSRILIHTGGIDIVKKTTWVTIWNGACSKAWARHSPPDLRAPEEADSTT